ncbi:type 1 glutamine amidotransferase domain-containing protein [Dyadobacter sp. CY312]|uniref:type 1 glutamine amidotransferase domain-containing protein n=1 Tax=Dyadobacter sp. CY312 TaxID=2907303 RepID=UPI001F1DBD95|nr:type 1 glutamine amidotransferase domain-containing protein [Dyadobacter sp. CY312]MCE7043842.1 type 1 glutamine amidotransferase [Dyadobacter sp. CY312]
MEHSSNSFKVAILVADGFEQVEMTCPRKILNQHGACVHVISPNKDLVKGWNRVDWGHDHHVDVPLNMARAEYYDALVLPGGVMSVDALRAEPNAIAFVRSFFNAGKAVAAICHGPQLLIDADVVIGRKLTSFATIRTDLENAGAIWLNKQVVVDNSLITSRNADDLPSFTSQLIKEFNLVDRQVSQLS